MNHRALTDLDRWEQGIVSKLDVELAHPGSGVSGLMALHDRLSVINLEETEAPSNSWAALRDRLETRPPSWLDRTRASLRKVAIVGASVGMLGTSAAYAAGVEPVRDAVDWVGSSVADLFGKGAGNTSDGKAESKANDPGDHTKYELGPQRAAGGRADPGAASSTDVRAGGAAHGTKRRDRGEPADDRCTGQSRSDGDSVGEHDDDQDSQDSGPAGKGDEEQEDNSGPGDGDGDEDQEDNSGPGGGDGDEDQEDNSGPGGDADSDDNSGPDGGEDDSDPQD